MFYLILMPMPTLDPGSGSEDIASNSGFYCCGFSYCFLLLGKVKTFLCQRIRQKKSEKD